MESILSFLGAVNDIYWYIGLVMILGSGVYISIKTRFIQFKILAQLKKAICELKECNKTDVHGVNPLRLYFASIGGMVGIGNVVSIVTAVTIGGPGALFWLWVAIFLGMLIKYTEIYLGILYREKCAKDAYNGGPMYFLRAAFKNAYIPHIVAVLFCIYAVEIYQFVVISDTLQHTFNINPYVCIGGLLLLILWTALGGIKRLSNVCAALMPPFIITYVLMCLWVIGNNLTLLPEILLQVIDHAFTGTSAVGGFAGATIIQTMQQGIARGVYAGDIGVGFDATLQATTKSKHPERQARMAIFSLATQGIICTMTLLVVLISGIWQEFGTSLDASNYIPRILSNYFPYVTEYMAVLFFLAGFTTIVAYFAVGLKTSRFLSQRYGPVCYITYAMIAFVVFSFTDQLVAQQVMALCSGLLLTFNIWGMMRLRHQVKYL